MNTPFRPTGLRQLKELLSFFSLLVIPRERRARLLYDIFSTHNILSEQSLYLNLGYWKNSPDTLDDACQAMAELLGDFAQFQAGNRILDVGFGFADQDMFWLERYSPESIIGLNITPSQVEVARKRVAERHLEDRINLQVGSATMMPFASESFDKVVALECAFHFVTRERFFQEAYRVLRPGGRIATAEILPIDQGQETYNPGNRLRSYRRQAFTAVPKENWYPADIYSEKLRTAGFENVQMFSIREYVYPPMVHYISHRLQDPEIKQRMNKFYHRGLLHNLGSTAAIRLSLETLDYTIAVADKPSLPLTY